MKLYNTKTRKLEEFSPLSKSEVTLYTCGPTVYSQPHIGNWLSFLRWDLLVRTLISQGYNVNRVMNITDVGHLTSDADEGEDKVQKGARQEGITEWEVADKYSKAFMEGMDQLNMVEPTRTVKATDHIDLQIKLVEKLESKGYTYVLDDGVYFDTSKFATYADFAKLDLTGMKAGARVAHNSAKRNPNDFVLWRLTPKGQHRAMEWDSPWGRGIPGWHIECSAMALHYLGDTIDIHTGGIDHIPVHHSNEIAQSESATGKPFANFWLHNAHLLSLGYKLSKSLNNSYTLEDLQRRGFRPADFRMFSLQSHYRTETNFSWENMSSAKQRLDSWLKFARLRFQVDQLTLDFAPDEKLDKQIEQHIKQAEKALADDLNSPKALVIVEQAMNDVQYQLRQRHHVSSQSIIKLVDWIDQALGLQLVAQTNDISQSAYKLIQQRMQAKAESNFAKADELRQKLESNHIVLDDTPYGTVWNKLPK